MNSIWKETKKISSNLDVRKESFKLIMWLAFKIRVEWE